MAKAHLSSFLSHLSKDSPEIQRDRGPEKQRAQERNDNGEDG